MVLNNLIVPLWLFPNDAIWLSQYGHPYCLIAVQYDCPYMIVFQQCNMVAPIWLSCGGTIKFSQYGCLPTMQNDFLIAVQYGCPNMVVSQRYNMVVCQRCNMVVLLWLSHSGTIRLSQHTVSQQCNVVV